MIAAGASIVDAVGRLIQERGFLNHPAVALDEATQRCLDAFWAFPDGVYDRSTAVGATG